MKEYLLSDEVRISEEDYKERKKIIQELIKMPEDFFSKLRHFQPQVGCLNCCSICSKKASSNVSFWNENRIKNVIAAIKYSSPRKEKPLIVWDRNSHRNGVIFSYLDNDVGNYYYLYEFIYYCYKELGVKTRISTVGYSRFNEKIQKMHEKISTLNDALGGVRLSFTPYEIGWCSKNTSKFLREDYKRDITNFLKTYKPYYNYAGSGYREFCVELRYKPLVENKKVFTFDYNNHFVICSNNYLYISKDKNIEFISTKISNPKIHRLELNNSGVTFNKLILNSEFKSIKSIKKYIDNNISCIEKEVQIYMVENLDGKYYSVDPILNDNGNYGICFYPKTKTRQKEGFIITERFFLNELLKYKKDNKISEENYDKVTWRDADNILSNLVNTANKFKNTIEDYKYQYIMNEIYPMVSNYASALKDASYPASAFIDKTFTIDTGIICNLGRAINEFKGLVSREDEPLTLNHERNYGKTNSKMTVEGKAWRLSCDYDDAIVIQELNLSNTATKEGQVSYCKNIKLKNQDIKIKFKDVDNNYLIPGQVKND